jgi:hypothetical protein
MESDKEFERNHARLSAVLSKKFRGPVPVADYAWPSPALNVLDCVLSLNRSYDRFCWPRVYGFALRNPSIISLGKLHSFIGRYRTPFEFGREQLDVSDERRMNVLVAVVEFLRKAQAPSAGKSELIRLRSWAAAATPDQSASTGIRGFKLAGFQYARMLFGAQTLKPDLHTISFVEEALGRSVTAVKALRLLESAGRSKGWPIRDLDFAIWEEGARPVRHNSKHQIDSAVGSSSILSSHCSDLFKVRFDGFVTVAALRSSQFDTIPDKPGVYMILRPLQYAPKFLHESPAGRFKGRDPSVSESMLRKNWVDGAYVLYVGKAGQDGARATLRSRLRCYLDHGLGKAVAHWGGRLVWQLDRAEQLLVAWRAEPNRRPFDVEQGMIDHFASQYGKKPFANLRR